MAFPGTSLAAVAVRPRVSPATPSAASVARKTEAGPGEEVEGDFELELKPGYATASAWSLTLTSSNGESTKERAPPATAAAAATSGSGAVSLGSPVSSFFLDFVGEEKTPDSALSDAE